MTAPQGAALDPRTAGVDRPVEETMWEEAAPQVVTVLRAAVEGTPCPGHVGMRPEDRDGGTRTPRGAGDHLAMICPSGVVPQVRTGPQAARGEATVETIAAAPG